MIKVEGYKAFRGVMRIVPKVAGVEPYEIKGDWLYRPESDCWYVSGAKCWWNNSFLAEICEVVEDYTK